MRRNVTLEAAPPVRLSEAVLIARVVACVSGAVATTLWRADADLWGHLRFGLDIVRDRALTAVDPYSFTSDVPWINHEWLSEALMGLAYIGGGVPGLLFLKAAVAGTAYIVMSRRLRHIEEPARWWFLSAAIVSTMTITTTLRPQLWTVLALTIITATTHWPVSRQFAVWPLVFAVWANLHGGWIVGLGVIGAWSTGVVLDRRDWRAVFPVGALCSACLLATLLTPYGLDLWRFMWSTVGFDRDIIEWHSVWETNSAVVMLIWIMVAVVSVIVLRSTPWSWAAVLPVVLLAISSLKVIRLIGLSGIVVALLMGTQWRRQALPRLQPAFLVLIGLMALIPAMFIVETQTRCLSVNEPDVAAAGALAGAEAGRLMVPFNWGQYAIWHFSPPLRVSMDGRRETVYSQSLIDQQLAFDRGDPSILPFIRSARPEYIWLYRTAGVALAESLTDMGYRRETQTDRSLILVRSDLPVLPTGPALSPCFP